MGRLRSDATMRDVELVDVEVPAAPEAGADPGADPGRRPHRHEHLHQRTPLARRRRRLVGTVVVVGLLAAGALVAERLSGDATVVARVAPGMLAPLDSPPWERWRAPVERGDDVVTGGSALVVADVRQGRYVATGLDVLSGAELWVRDLGVVSGVRPLTGCLPAGGAPGADAVVPAGPIAGTARGAAGGTTGGTDGVLLCVVEAPRVADRAGNAPTGSAALSPWQLTELRVTALVAGTGEVVGEWRERSRLLDLARVDDDLVVLAADDAGVARVERRAGATGEVRWDYTSAEPLRLRQGAAARPSVQVSTSFVLVQAWSAIVLDAEDGSEVVTSPAGRVVIGALSGDRAATWSSGTGGRVYDEDGTELFRTQALFPPLAASDGSVPEVLVLDEGGSVVGRSLPDGAELWRLDTYRSVRLVAGGSVVLVGVDGYQVLDARTGEPRWELPYRQLMWWAPVSDGSLVLGPGRTGTGAPTVEARRLDDGTVAWVLPLDPGARAVSAVGGHLVVRTRDELVMLG